MGTRSPVNVNQGGVQKTIPQVTRYTPLVNHCLKCRCRFDFVIFFPLLVELTDKLPRIFFGVRVVTSPDEELKTIHPSPFVLHYTHKVFRLLTC